MNAKAPLIQPEEDLRSPMEHDDASAWLADRSPASSTLGLLIRQIRKMSDAQIDQILDYQRKEGVRFGDAAVALRLATTDEVRWALSQQFKFPYTAVLDKELIMASEPFGAQAEAIRDLRSRLLAETHGEDLPPRALAIVSADRGDGKTYFAANIAIALSQLGGNTLLIDADLRHGRLHTLFGLPNKIGLSTLIAGRAGQEAIRHLDVLPSLHVLPTGALPPNPQDLVQRREFGEFIGEALARFEHVIVDTPAASLGADCGIIAGKCGVALTIASRHDTRLGAAAALFDALSRTSTSSLGILVNEHRSGGVHGAKR